MGNNEVICTECGSNNWTNAGLGRRNRKKNIQRRLCHGCGKIFVLPNSHPFAFCGKWESYNEKKR